MAFNGRRLALAAILAVAMSIASEGPPVDSKIANAAPILDVAAQPLGPTLTPQQVEGLPPELQPSPGDILIAQSLWPWDQLNAKGVPEQYLYMGRHVQGTLAVLSGLTSKGPRLVKINDDGSIQTAVIQAQNTIFNVSTSAAPPEQLFSAPINDVLAAGAHRDLNSLIPGLRTHVVAWQGDVSSIGSANVNLESGSGIIWGTISTAITGYFFKQYWGIGGPVEDGSGNGFMRIHNVSGVAAGGITGEVIYYFGP